jgi:uncharacterized protein (DUF2062 family)
MFTACISAPFQMAMAVAAAARPRVNLPGALADMRVTSPLYMGPIFFMACRLGIWTFGFARSAVTRVGDAGMPLRCDWTWLDARFCRDAS